MQIESDIAACEQCGSTPRVGRGFCLNCLLQRGLSKIEKSETLDAVLDEIEWFIALRDRSGQAERFFIYFEREMSREVLEQMLAFLALPRDERYLEAAAAAFRIGRPRRKEQAVIDRFAKQVSKKFQRHPQIRDGLLKFAKPSER